MAGLLQDSPSSGRVDGTSQARALDPGGAADARG